MEKVDKRALLCYYLIAKLQIPQRLGSGYLNCGIY